MGSHVLVVVDGIAFGLLLFTLAIGLSLVFGMMRVLNLAHGSLYLGGAVLAYLLVGGTWTGLAVALVAATVLGAAAGVVLSVATVPLARRPGHQAMLTFGVAFIAADVFATLTRGDVLSVRPPGLLAGTVSVSGQTYPIYRLVFVAVGILLAAGVYLLVERSSLGALIRATVADNEMVQAMGINTKVLLGAVFAAGSALAALGGVAGAPILGAAPDVDSVVLMLCLVVVIVGGLGSVRGGLIAALLVGQVQTLGTSLVPGAAGFLLFGVMLLVLILRPHGLAGSQTA